MGSGLRKRGKTKNPSDYYKPTPEDWDAYRFCVKNNIRISIVPQEKGNNPETFRVSVIIGEYKRGEKPHLSPNVYSIEIIKENMYKACKYYYEKYK